MFGDGIVAVMYRSSDQLLPHRTLSYKVDAAFALTHDYYWSINPWVLRSRGKRPPIVFADDLIPGSEFERTEFYNDWLRPQELRYSFNVGVPLNADVRLEVAVIRPRQLGPITAAESKTLSGILPHMTRAGELSQRLSVAEATRSAWMTTARRVGTTLILVDANRRVVFADSEAERLLARGGLRIRGGLLRGAPAIEARLEEALSQATGRGCSVVGRSGSLLTVPRLPDRLPLSVAIGPVDERDSPSGLPGPLAMVVITDPEHDSGPNEDALRDRFDLTPAEAKLVAALCAGETLASYTEATGTSLNTTKTHLKRVFDKTGETRQADLVRRVANDVALRFASRT